MEEGEVVGVECLRHRLRRLLLPATQQLLRSRKSVYLLLLRNFQPTTQQLLRSSTHSYRYSSIQPPTRLPTVSLIFPSIHSSIRYSLANQSFPYTQFLPISHQFSTKPSTTSTIYHQPPPFPTNLPPSTNSHSFNQPSHHPPVYTLFALSEYTVVISNILFHMTGFLEFSNTGATFHVSCFSNHKRKPSWPHFFLLFFKINFLPLNFIFFHSCVLINVVFFNNFFYYYFYYYFIFLLFFNILFHYRCIFTKFRFFSFLCANINASPLTHFIGLMCYNCIHIITFKYHRQSYLISTWN